MVARHRRITCTDMLLPETTKSSPYHSSRDDLWHRVAHDSSKPVPTRPSFGDAPILVGYCHRLQHKGQIDHPETEISTDCLGCKHTTFLLCFDQSAKQRYKLRRHRDRWLTGNECLEEIKRNSTRLCHRAGLGLNHLMERKRICDKIVKAIQIEIFIPRMLPETMSRHSYVGKRCLESGSD